MTFVSYAQNYEDVMLYRALKHVENGFYIDVGANDPVTDSVTKAFYDMGWRGLNIEPVRQWLDRLQSERPDDINLQVAVSDQNGELRFFEVVDTGLSTCNEEIAMHHVGEHGFQVREYAVPTQTLTMICAEHGVGEVHFLKIDVEGAEAATLRGLDLERIRPWIIVVEATLPNTQVSDYQEWEPLLIRHGYHFVYFDGLNRFYVANEHAELDSNFLTPPNYFDGFIRINEHRLTEQLEMARQDKEAERQQKDAALHEKEHKCQLLEEALVATLDGYQLKQTLFDALRDKRAQCEQLEAALHEKDVQRQQLEAALRERHVQLQQLQKIVNDILHSRSWRVTKPLRWISLYVKKIYPTGSQAIYVPVLFTKRVSEASLHRLVRVVLARPRLTSLASKALSYVPVLKANLKRVAEVPVVAGQYFPRSPEDLSPRAQQVWQDLMQARAQSIVSSKEQMR